MARVTYRYLAYDVLETFRQISDDSEIGLTQVVFWINVIANRIRKQHIKKMPTGAHLLIFQNVPTSIEPSSNRKYFDLPKSIYDFEYDNGIDYITYQNPTDCCDSPAFSQVFFNRTTPRNSHRLYMDPYETPSTTNPFFYRAKERIFILGLECIDAVPLEMGLYANIDINVAGCSLDDEIDLDEELISVLKYEVLNLGRFALIVPNERINEGSDLTTQQVRDSKIQIPQLRQPSGLTSEEIQAMRAQQMQQQ